MAAPCIIWDAADPLVAATRPLFGPLCGDVLIRTAASKIILTNSGALALSTVSRGSGLTQIQRWLCDAVKRFASLHGDGTITLVLLVQQILQQARRCFEGSSSSGTAGSSLTAAGRQRLAWALNRVADWIETQVFPQWLLPAAEGGRVSWTRVLEVLETATGSAFGSEASGRVARVVLEWVRMGVGEEAGRRGGKEGEVKAEAGAEAEEEGASASLEDTVSVAELGKTVQRFQRLVSSLIVTCPGASLSRSRVLNPGHIILRRPLLANHLLAGQSHLSNLSGSVGLVVINSSLEPCSPDTSSTQSAGTVIVDSLSAYTTTVTFRRERLERLFRCLRDHGVQLVLCTEALNDPIPQICRGLSMLAVQSIEDDDAALICTITGVSCLDPRDLLQTGADLNSDAAGLDRAPSLETALETAPSLGSAAARTAASIAEVDEVKEAVLGGKHCVHLRGLRRRPRPQDALHSNVSEVNGVPGGTGAVEQASNDNGPDDQGAQPHPHYIGGRFMKPVRCPQLLLHGPSEGLCAEYGKGSRRLIAVLHSWLNSKPAGALVAGGGAWQLAGHWACLRAAADLEAGGERRSTVLAQVGRGSTGVHDRAAAGKDAEQSLVMALRITAEALLTVPRQVFLSMYQRPQDGLRTPSRVMRHWNTILQSLKTSHLEAPSRCGIVIAFKGEDHTKGEEVFIDRPDAHGIVHPAATALDLVKDAYALVAQLLRLDGIVPVRAGSGPAHRGTKEAMDRTVESDDEDIEEDDDDNQGGGGGASASS